MQDTPQESLLDELGFGKETTERDALDESLARMLKFCTLIYRLLILVTEHSRFVYKLQDSDVSESSSEDDESDNSESATRRRSRHSRVKRHTNGRMSLLTGRYFDVQGHHNHKESKPKNARRFFQSRLGWSDMHEKVVVKGEEADFFARGRLAELMERGGLNVNATEDRWGSEERLSAAEDEWIEMDED